MKKTVLAVVIVVVFVLSQKISFPREAFTMDLSHILEYEMEIRAKYIKLIVKAYEYMEAGGIDLTDYTIEILSESGILHLRFRNPVASQPGRWRSGPPPGAPILNFQIDIESGEIIRITGER